MNQPRSARDRIDRALAITRRMRRFVLPALGLVLVGAAATITYATMRERVFKSEALILYREGVRPSHGDGEELADGAQRLGLRLNELALSRTRLEQIITAARLYPDAIEEGGMVEAVDEMRKHIAFRAQDGETFVLSFEGPNPARVKEVTAQLADALVSDNARASVEPAPVTEAPADSDKERGDKARFDKELKDKGAALTQFLAKHPEFARETAQGGKGPAAAPVEAAAVKPAGPPRNDATLASLQREVDRLQERLDAPVKNGRKEEAQADPALVASKQAAEAELRQAQKELAEKQGEFTDEHPDVREARLRVKLAQDKLRRAGEAVGASLSAAQQKSVASQEDEGYIDRGALENQLKRINEEIVDYKRRKATASAPTTKVASSVVALEADWTRLNRDAIEARQRAESLPDKERKPAPAHRAAVTGRTAEMAVIDPPFVPTREVPPGHTQIMVAGLAATVLLSMLLALGLALVDDRIYDRVDIERLGMLPLLGVVPRPAKGDEKVKLG